MWARPHQDQNLTLRRGAWYRVVRLLQREVVLEVNRHVVVVPRRFVEIVPSRPLRWAIVPRPRDALRIPPHWGTCYAVCPSCRQRVPAQGGAASMRCPRCSGLFLSELSCP